LSRKETFLLHTAKEQEQSLGIMEKIDIKIMNIKDIKQLLFEGRILNAASIVALYRALDFHSQRAAQRANTSNRTNSHIVLLTVKKTLDFYRLLEPFNEVIFSKCVL
jgi:hypothetical protein